MSSSPKPRLLPHAAVLGPYFWLTYAAVLINISAYLGEVRYVGWIAPVYGGVVFLTHGLLYLAVPFALILAADALLSPRLLGRWLFARRPGLSGVVVYPLAVLLFGAVQNLLYVDRVIFQMFGFHLNGFVWNLVTTRGGIESMGGSESSTLTFGLIVTGFFALQAVLLLLALKIGRLRAACSKLQTRLRLWRIVAVIVLLTAAQAFAYGVFSLFNYTPVLVVANTFPFHQHVTVRGFAKKLGFDPPKTQVFRSHGIELVYPLRPLERRPDAPHYNVVWLVAESWRGDMLDPEIMPATWAFSNRAARFRQHYSGGNGTRMGLFGLFYGLYGPYWFSFLQERKGPVLIDLLVNDGYQMELFTSAKFTYPEFDKTVFANIPPERLHEDSSSGEGWERDQRNVTRLIDFIEQRDPNRSFMTFLFFESPHAHYYFPPENAIRTPYPEDVNYATLNLKRDVPGLKVRYINSCNHLDTQFARVLKELEDRGLLDSTIVVLTGDHGEEFMEKGFWGHNKTVFTEEQSIAPLVMWVPGHEPVEVTRMTSHLDVPATILTALGVTNPPEEYSSGFDLFGDRRRSYTVVSGYHSVAYVDGQYKAVFPTSAYGFAHERSFTSKDDRQDIDAKVFLETHQASLIEIMNELNRFKR